jgi:hypothetical protein
MNLPRFSSFAFLGTAYALCILAGSPAFACQKPVERVHWLNGESDSYKRDYCSAVLKGFSPVRCLRTPDERAADLDFCRNQDGAPYSFQGVE